MNAPIRLLLLKSVQFAHTGKYALYGTPPRWHMVHPNKPAPKGAPVAHAPHAAGQHMPATLQPEQVEALKYPADKAAANKEMAAFNDKHLPDLLAHGANGDATAILGSSYGVNSHGKKKAHVANYLLAAMGSAHKVAPGQGAGEHEAVKAPKAADALGDKDAFMAALNAITADFNNAEAKSKIVQELKDSGHPEAAAKFAPDALSKKISEIYAIGKRRMDNLEPVKQTTDKLGYTPPAGDGAVGFENWLSDDELQLINKLKLALPTSAESVAQAKANIQAKIAAKKAAKVTSNVADQLAMKKENPEEAGVSGGAAEQSGPAMKKKPAVPAGTGLAMPAFHEGKTTTGVVQYYEKVAQKIIDHAEAGNVSVLEGMVDTTKGKTWLGKTENSKLILALHAKALEHAKGGGAPATDPKDEALQAAVDHLKEDAKQPGMPAGEAAEDKALVEKLEAAQSATDGPKEGDTKPAADGGTLVFKDGHWHKQDQAPAPAEPSIPEPPQFSGVGGNPIWAERYAKVAKALHEKVLAEGAAAFKGVVISHSDGVFSITLAGFKLKKVGPDDKPEYRKQMHAYVTALKAAVGKAPKAPKAKPVASAAAAPAPASAAVPAGSMPSMDSWIQTGPQAGSNPGGKFKDPSGQEWYCKFPADEDVAKSEVLAAKLYAAMGIAGQDAKLVTKDGKVGIASKWATVSKASPSTLAKTDGVAAGFGADAWLGNWDVVGMAFDNLQVGADGKAVRVDAGGSLQYRAQGGKKAFGNTVIEVDSLRDASINPQAAAVFGKLTHADISASVAKVLSVPDFTITMLVNQFGPGDAANKQTLIETLIARKADLAAKYPKAVKAKKKPVFDASKINEPPNFLNWGGSGKPGPSSKDFLNEANHKAAQAIFDAAKTGDIDAVKGIEAPTFDKNTGIIVGHKAVLEHPSQHIKGYAQQVINEINFQMNPPKQFRFDGGHPLHSLNASYPAFTGQLQSTAVSKVGKFITLGDPGVLSVDALGLPKITHKSGQLTASTYAAAAQAAIAKMPETQRQAVQAYTGSSYHAMNSSLWAGNPVGKAKAAAAALHTLGHDIAPGTVLSRKISVHGDDLNQILGSTGKVLQEPAIMSTSIRPSSWSGNVHLKLHVGPGVKGLWVGHGSKPGGGALSLNSGEDEMVLPPNTRILILSVKKGGGDEDGFGVGLPHVIEAVILPSEGY